MDTGAPGRLTHIDAIRAIAALLVIVMHCCASVAPGAGSWLAWSANTLDFGRLGIVLFFAVSGFVIPGSLKTGQHPATFWVRRFFRLYPVYWLSILLVILVQWDIAGHLFGMREIAANLTMLQNFVGYENMEGVYWTLKLELFFYFLCYLLFVLKLLERVWVLETLSAGMALLFLAYLDYWSGPFGFMRHLMHALMQAIGPQGGHNAAASAMHHPLPGLINMNWGYFSAYFSVMFLGAVLRRWYERRLTVSQRGLLYVLLAFWLVALPVMGILAYCQHPDTGLIAIYAPFPLAILLFVLLTFRVRIQAKSMAMLGVLSYSMYLIHPMVIDILLSLGARTGAAWRHAGPLALASIAITAGLSFVCYRFVERPGIARGHQLAAYLQRRQAHRSARV